MKDQPERDAKTLEAIEACRPHRGDLSDPAMAPAAAELAVNGELDDLYQRLQRFDAVVAKAFQDVAVPDGLAERILDRLAKACPEPEALREDPAVEPRVPAEPLAAVADQEPLVSRRWLMVGTGGIVAAALMLAAVVFHVRQPDYDEAAVLDVAMQFFESDWEESQAGRPLVEGLPRSGCPLSPHVLREASVRWRSVSGFLGRRGVAYDLARPGRPRATLYVVKHPPVGLPLGPSRTPSLTTRNLSTSAWQSGTLLFVLVVEGGPRTYQGFLNLPNGPLT